MSSHTQLKVYKECNDLLLILFTSTPNIQREYRHTVAETTKKDLIELCILIYRANKTDDLAKKLTIIEDAQESLVRVVIQCRILAELKQISVKLFSLVSTHTISIEKQLDAWYSYTKTKLAKDNAAQ